MIWGGLVAGGAMLAIIIFIGIRMAVANNNQTHYHANFAVYVDGQRLKFEGPTFYEEETACNNAGPNDTHAKAHMHDNVNDVIHVHDTAITWSYFFTNLRYGLSDKALTLDDRVLVDGQDGKHLTFILNGQKVDTIAGKVIGDQDALLISYGSEDQAAIKTQYDSIAHTAVKEDAGKDPAACTGNKPLTFSERFKRAVSVNQAK